MKPLNGYSTSLDQHTGTPEASEDYNHAWQVLFAYEGPEMAMREVKLAGLPNRFPCKAIRQVVLDKQAFSAKSIEQVKPTAKTQMDVCVLCKLAFGSEYDDPNFGRIIVTRNWRNKFFCNTCDLFTRICPGQATLELPVLVVDVKHSRQIRNNPNVSLVQYSHLLSDFHCTAAAIIQKHLGMVLNTVGDAVIGVWPSGFLPNEIRNKYGYDRANPARISANFALKAAQEIADLSPDRFTGTTLPFKGALDSTQMVIFAVRSCHKLAKLEYSDLDGALAGPPLVDDEGNLLVNTPKLCKEELNTYQKGPTAIDIAGEAIELGCELSGHSSLDAGDVAITQRLDAVAGQMHDEYTTSPEFSISYRIIKPSSI